MKRYEKIKIFRKYEKMRNDLDKAFTKCKSYEGNIVRVL